MHEIDSSCLLQYPQGNMCETSTKVFNNLLHKESENGVFAYCHLQFCIPFHTICNNKMDKSLERFQTCIL